MDRNTASRALDFLTSDHLLRSDVADFVRVVSALKQIADGRVVVVPAQTTQQPGQQREPADTTIVGKDRGVD